MPSPLMQALYRGDEKAAAEVRATLTQPDVFEAAALGDVETLRVLLDADTSRVSAWSDDGFTPLHYASFFGRPEAARLLLERGADLEAPARNEQFALEARPLHSALAARQKEVAVLLLDAGADVNAREHEGTTPLHEAAQHGDAELVRLLLERGADPAAKLDDGRTPVDLAAGHPEVLELLD
jgi:ankyrin repeat protein